MSSEIKGVKGEPTLKMITFIKKNQKKSDLCAVGSPLICSSFYHLRDVREPTVLCEMNIFFSKSRLD
jgi:hypothetical protein